MKPIEIVGGGLAGLALGVLLARQRVPVRVLERAVGRRHRVCGEFLRGVGPEVWEALGIAPPQETLRRTVRWWVGGRALAPFTLPRPAVAWSRPELEERLREMLVAHGSEVTEGVRGGEATGPGQVWAMGRRPDPASPWFGFKCHVVGMQLTSDLEMHVGRGGYLGLTQVGRAVVNVSGLFRADAGARPGRGSPLERLAGLADSAGLGAVADRLAEAEGWEAGSAVAAAGIRFGWAEVSPGTMAIGDARVFLPPFTGRGMALALDSARVAARELRAYCRGEQAWAAGVQAVEGALRRRWRRTVRVACWLQAGMMSPRWQPGLGWWGARGWLPMRTLAGWVS